MSDNSINKIVLASKSPRRCELLLQIGVQHRCIEIDIDESPLEGERAAEYVLRLARSKAEAGLSQWQKQSANSLPVLAADTIVVLGDEHERLLGKPKNRDEMISMLSDLSGRDHRVLTAIGMTNGERTELMLSETRVYFRALSQEEIFAYCTTDEPRDKAGSYGIQGMAALFIERIEGSYSGVMGLPLCETGLMLSRFGIEVLPHSR